MTAKKSESLAEALPRRIKELRRTLQKRVRSGIDDVTDLLPAGPRKALKRLTANVERAQTDLRKNAEKALNKARKRAEDVADNVQERIGGVVSPLVKRLDVASRTDVNHLNKRVRDLERRLHTHHESTAA
jgi:polyhydroxyalkanoate synthesis regulator phasin